MTVTKELQEATGRRASAQAVVTRHLNALKKLMANEAAITSDNAVDHHNKLSEALGKFTTCHDAILGLCEELSIDNRDHLDLHFKITSEVDSVLEQLQAKLNAPQTPEVRPKVTDPAEHAAPDMEDLSPGSKKTLSLIQLAMSTMATPLDENAVDRKLREQEARHKEETGSLISMINALRTEISELKSTVKPGGSSFHGMSTPAGRHPGRVTFGLSETKQGDDMNSYLETRALGGSEPAGGGKSGSVERDKPTAAVPMSGLGQTQLGADTTMNSLLLQQQMFEHSISQHKSLMATLKAPALTIAKFTGDPLEFASFASAFDELVDGILDNPRAKLTSLMSHCGEKPLKLIRSCQHEPSAEGYAHARRLLREKFGSPYVVSQAWINKLIGYPSLTSPDLMESFSADLASCRNALGSLGYLAELKCTNNMRLLIAKLPFTLRTRWRKLHREIQQKGEGDSLEKLLELVREASDDLTDPAFSEAAIGQIRSKPSAERPGHGAQYRKAGINCLEADHSDEFGEPGDELQTSSHKSVYHNERDQPTCSVCQSSLHYTSRCKNYRSLKPGEKFRLVREKKLCTLCLSARHEVDSCPLPWKCQEKKCSRRHHTSLHSAIAEQEAQDSSVNNTNIDTENLTHVVNHLSDNSFHLSRVVPTLPLTPVTVRYNGKTTNTYALLDQGSTLTMCHQRISRALGIIPTGTSTVNIRTVTGVEQVIGNNLNFEIAGVKIGKFLPVEDAMEVSELPVSLNHMATASRLTEWEHLRDLDLNLIESADVDLLIGTDNADILEPMKKRKGTGQREPYAVLTPVGWTIFGAGSRSRSSAKVVGSIQSEEHCYNTSVVVEPPCTLPLDGCDGVSVVHEGHPGESRESEPVTQSPKIDMPCDPRYVMSICPETGCVLVDGRAVTGSEDDKFGTSDCEAAAYYLQAGSTKIHDSHPGGEIDLPEDCFFSSELDKETITNDVVERLFEFFKTEEVPDCSRYSEEEQYVLDLWDRSWKLVDGHIQLPIPFKSDDPEFPDNFYMAVMALKSLGKRLKKNPRELDQYRTAMEKAVQLRVSELVTSDTPVNLKLVWYLLHHGVDHPRKPDVTRVVKNGSGKWKGVSLNQMTFQGPDLMNDLIKVMLGFRLYEVGVSGDVDGMFDQVLVPEDQRDCQRYVWFENGDPDGRILVYRMRTHSFGTNWAPAAANYALQKTVEIKPVHPDPRVNQSVINDFYVDDWLDSEENDKEASSMVAGIRETVAKGGFNIGKFSSNCRAVLTGIELERRAKELAKVDLLRDRLPQGYSLGSGWDQELDQLMYRLKDDPKPLTRRGTTSFLAALYDPMGLLAPAILPGKLLLRESCVSGEGWDTPLPGPLEDQWEKWIANMVDVNEFQVDRWLGCRSGCINELHVFGDACDRSYGAAGYLCIRDVDMEYVECSLIMAKSKLGPKHVITVPRMELCAAVLAVKLGRYLQAVLRVEITAVYYWSDSAIILKLMLGNPAAYKPFFGNRISYIQANSDTKQWGHVPTNANPADLVSRGVPVNTLINNDLWIHGPDYLQRRKECWPRLDGDIPVADLSNEVRKSREIFACSVEELHELPEIVPELIMTPVDREVNSAIENDQDLRMEVVCCPVLLTRAERLMPGPSSTTDVGAVTSSIQSFLMLKSSLATTVKMVAWLKRFILYASSGLLIKGALEVHELEMAEESLVRATQIQFLTDDEKNSVAYKKLIPFTENGVLRVGGRLRHADLSMLEKHQYLVPRKSPLANQVMEDAHKRIGHSGADWTVAEIRKRFWIVGGRGLVSKFVRCCLRCRKATAKPLEQLMADLPRERVDFNTPAFWNTGVDLFGPFLVAVKRSSEKRHGAVFTCLTTRAIHIEVVIDLSASSFLNALARFIARRGKPRRIRSDNGTNFVCSKRLLEADVAGIDEEKVQRKLSEVGIHWSLNTPSASHQGGAWERMVRTIRKILSQVLDGVKLTHEILETGFCAVEQIVNDRPLTRINDDTDSLSVLTPSMLLNLRPGGKLMQRAFSGEQLRRDWRQAQWIADEFWRVWTAQYLPNLQRRAKWLEMKDNLSVGELVLIVNDTCARGDWPLGVVMEVHPGVDGLVRNATIRTATGEYRRPVTKIVKLEGDVG